MSTVKEQKGGGFLASLRSAFIAEDEPSPQEETAPAKPVPRPEPVAAVPSPSPAQDPELIRKIDEQAMARLQGPVEAVAGTYAEFMASMEALAEAVPDMGQRQRAVIKLMTKKKIPLPKILSDLDACIGALEQEGRTFRSESEKHVEKKVGGLKAESESISSTIAAKEAQLAALQAELSALRSSKSAKDADVRAAEDMAATVQARFTVVYNGTHAAMTAQRKQVSDLIDKEQV